VRGKPQLSPKPGIGERCGGEGGRVTPSGPYTGVLAVIAATVGSGVLLGGFVAGLIDVARRGIRPDPTQFVRFGGYWGGVAALLLLLLETIR
jgi:hypothetical protein